MRYERAAVSREAVKLCQPIRTLSFVRLGTVTSGLQVCSFPWDVLCSQAAGAEPTTLAASVLPARWRPCHYAIIFISGHILSAEMTSGTGNLEPKAKLNWPGESFMEQIFKNQCPFPLQGFSPASSSDSEEHWIIRSSSKLRGSRVALFVPGKACRADGTLLGASGFSK